MAKYKSTRLLNDYQISELANEGWELVQIVPEIPKMYWKKQLTDKLGEKTSMSLFDEDMRIWLEKYENRQKIFDIVKEMEICKEEKKAE